MSAMNRLKQSPTLITLSAWALFYAGFFSTIGSFVLLSIIRQLLEQHALSERFATAMYGCFAFSSVVSVVVYLWALKRWARHFVASARLYRRMDVLFVAIVGLAIAAGVAYCVQGAGGA
ncbi:hypothetical protein WOB59_00865 [Methylocystis sp. IM4]|uniref:hypothetical protein n=1 Tax=Methylocystis sp. IM4 TaxID=3136560 RepID=UPI00311A249E